VTYFSQPGSGRSLEGVIFRGGAMAEAGIARAGLSLAVARFPGEAATLCRLALAQRGFRELCEEYALARESLARFEARADAAERSEVAEYRTVIAELEREIDRYVKAASPDA
jgi:hypothetical protein